MREDDKFLLLQRFIIRGCISILATCFYSASVLHLPTQWNELLKKEGLRDIKSQPWMDLVRILAYLHLEQYEEAQVNCQKYLRLDHIKDDTNAQTNNSLNAYGF
ncbi:hypothetical protein TWF751_010836 [Orbilia oligospora]|nr:hypothetical protein TWF751_010836 [Orbilia oligospora]